MSDSSDEDNSQKSRNKGKSFLEKQRLEIEQLMENPEKEVVLPDFNKEQLPRAFFPHEFVRNVMGASAGAGSGEFDIYRGCRNRELARQEYLQQKSNKEKQQKEFEEKRAQSIAEAEKKTAKKRAKRLKQKQKLKEKHQKNDKNSSKHEDGTKSSDEEAEEEIDLDEILEKESEQVASEVIQK